VRRCGPTRALRRERRGGDADAEAPYGIVAAEKPAWQKEELDIPGLVFVGLFVLTFAIRGIVGIANHTRLKKYRLVYKMGDSGWWFIGRGGGGNGCGGGGGGG